jgi:hypothetical protein
MDKVQKHTDCDTTVMILRPMSHKYHTCPWILCCTTCKSERALALFQCISLQINCEGHSAIDFSRYNAEEFESCRTAVKVPRLEYVRLRSYDKRLKESTKKETKKERTKWKTNQMTRMLSSGMWRCVALVRTDVSENVLRLLLNTNVSSSPILLTLMMEAIHSSETSVLTRSTKRHIP